jgi:glutaminyl-peptide cyclotransferase
LASLGNYAANPLLGLGPYASFASIAAAASFADPQVIAGPQGFQPYPVQPYPAQPYPVQPYLAQPYPTQPYPTQPYLALPYPTPPYAVLQGNLISWPRAEVLTPATSPVAPVNYTYTVINTFPHDRTAFTEGLVYDNGFLYEGTGVPGRSQVRKVDILTGTVLQSLDLPSPYFGEGITIYGNTIIELTWLHNIGFVYDKLTFAQLETFSYPTEGWGLTHDGKNLIMSDGTATLHFLDPITFTEVGSVDVYDQNGPVPLLNELEYIKGEIYANVWLTDRIARISPITGQVVGWIDLTGILSPADIIFPIDVLNGIAYDAKNDRLFVTGKYWPKLFEIDLIPLL